jgi:hypothetical protein
MLFLPRLALDHDLPIYASHVAGIIGVIHHVQPKFTILSAQFSGVKCIHIVVQLSQLSIPELFHHVKQQLHTH